MTTPELISFIKSQLAKNLSKEEITSKLVTAGWYKTDIEEGFKALTLSSILASTTPSSTPVVSKPTTSTTPPLSTISKSIFSSASIGNNPKVVESVKPTELAKELAKVVEMPRVTPKVVEPPKIWTPSSVAPATDQPVVSNPVVSVATPASPLEFASNFIPVKPQPTSTAPSSTTVPHPIISTYEKDIDLLSSKKFESKINPSPNIKSANAATSNNNKHPFFKILITIIIIMAIFIGGAVFAYMKGYVKIPESIQSLNIFSTKKDPKLELISAITALDSLTSYKVESSMNLSSPLLANIASGLIGVGDPKSKQMDSLAFRSKGFINQRGSVQTGYNYIASIKSSLFKDEMIFRFKFDGKSYFMNLPALNQILGNNAPAPSIVSYQDGELQSLDPLLREDIRDMVNTYDTFKIVYKGLPAVTSLELSKAFQNLITSSSIAKTEDQTVAGVDTSYYQITVTQEASQKLFSDISDIFFAAVPLEKKTNLVSGLKSINIDSLEFWINKKDGNIYQYKFTLDVPIAKILSIEDANLDLVTSAKVIWQSKIYDVGVSNVILMKDASMPLVDFIKNLNDMKIKDTVDSFKASATDFHTVMGNYGKTGNTLGSCQNPLPGSLFSNLGHNKKGIVAPVEVVAKALSGIIKVGAGKEVCYSTSKDWSVALPLVSDASAFYCVDSLGVSKVLPQSPKSSECK